MHHDEQRVPCSKYGVHRAACSLDVPLKKPTAVAARLLSFIQLFFVMGVSQSHAPTEARPHEEEGSTVVGCVPLTF
jgi:hypothetical protein